MGCWIQCQHPSGMEMQDSCPFLAGEGRKLRKDCRVGRASARSVQCDRKGFFMYPHRIRLRGPWDYEILACHSSEEPLTASGRMILPGRWTEGGLAGFRG